MFIHRSYYLIYRYYYNADNDKCMQNCTYPTKPWPPAGVSPHSFSHTKNEKHLWHQLSLSHSLTLCLSVSHSLSLVCARSLALSLFSGGAGDYSCTDLVNNRACWGGHICTTNCYPTETVANNFIVLRSMTGNWY